MVISVEAMRIFKQNFDCVVKKTISHRHEGIRTLSRPKKSQLGKLCFEKVGVRKTTLTKLINDVTPPYLKPLLSFNLCPGILLHQ